MYGAARVSDSGVCGDASIRIEDREKSRRRPALHPTARQGLERACGNWATGDVPGDRLALIPQKIRAPAPRAVQLPELIQGHASREIDVGLQSIAIGNQNPHQLRAYFARSCLERLEPGELRTIEELDFR